MASRRIVFGETAAGRIVSAVKRVEASPYFAGGGPPSGPRLWNPGVLEARVVTAISAATATAYGTGTVHIQIDDGSGNFIDDPAYPNNVSVMNYYKNSGTISAGTHVMIGWRNGGFRLVGADC